MSAAALTGADARPRQAVQAALLGALLVAVALVFWPALAGPFIFDDFPNLENLRHLGGELSLDSITRYLASIRGMPDRPLAMLSFLIEDFAWPAAPGDFKRNNLWLHLLTGLLVCALCLRLARLRGLATHAAGWIALAATAAWLLSPIQLSSTMLIVQRMNILSGLFVLLGLLCYLRALTAVAVAPTWRVVLAGAALGLFGLLAFLSKENGVLVFAYAAVLNATLLRPTLQDMPRAARRLLLAGVALPLLLLALGAVVAWEQRILAPYQFREFGLGERLLSQPRALVGYLFNIFMPRIGGQGILHDDFVVSRGLLEPWTTLPALLLVSASILYAWIARRRQPLLAFAVLWFFAGHVLESSIISLELYFEHRNYLPMIGPLFALASVALQPRERVAGALRGLFGLWLLMLTALTAVNARTWGDRGQQAYVWLIEHPRSERAIQWSAGYDLDTGNVEAARRTLADGIERLPNAHTLRLQLGLLDCLSRGVDARGWRDMQDAMRRVRHSHLPGLILTSLVKQLDTHACHGTLDAARVQSLAETLLANPLFARSPEVRSHVHYELGKMYLGSGRGAQMMRQLDAAYLELPNPTIPREQAIYLINHDDAAGALRYLDRSDSTPQPWMKRQLLDVAELNRPLREFAERQARRSAAPEPTP